MASHAAPHPRHQGPRLFEGLVLFKRGRGSIHELVAFVWLATEVVRFVREHLDAASWGRERTRTKEGFGWRK